MVGTKNLCANRLRQARTKYKALRFGFILLQLSTIGSSLIHEFSNRHRGSVDYQQHAPKHQSFLRIPLEDPNTRADNYSDYH